ncbi:MAG: leucine-rich repeat domain-containing protein, partial [Anaeroplasmataceae bacterium]|nr:leucine-rich repeat domain-containing protein [Anaeroplasmataceae bacterium]
MKINKRKITIWSIMTLSLVMVLTFVLVCHFRKIDNPSASNENDYSHINYVEINDGADYLSYADVTIDGTAGLKVVGFASNFTTSVSKAPTDMYSLTVPEIHNGKRVLAIDIPKINAGTAADPYEVPWLSGTGVEEQIGKVIVPKTVLKISEGAFNAFTELRQMELPFVGTERGNTKGTAFNKNTSGNCSFYAIFGTDKFQSMNDYNLQAITTSDGINTLEDLKAKRAINAAISYGTGQINWYFNSSTDSSSVLYFNVPINLEEVFITDEYCVADHAFFRSPALKKVSIQWSNNIPSDQKLASGFGQRVFDTSTALEFVVLPSSLSSYGAGLFSHCLSLHTVAVGGVETGETSYTELNSTYPKRSTGEFIKQVHLPLENPAGLVEGSDVKIEESTFEFCISIENMVIPHNVTSIKAHAFDGCTNMTNVRSSSNSYSIGNYCDLPDNLELIERLAFRNCTALQNITVPRNVKKIEEAAFNRCSALQTITLPFVGSERGNDGGSVRSLFGYIFGQYGNSEAGDTSATPDACVFQATDGNPSKNRNEGDMTPRGEFYIPQSLKNVVITDETVLVSGAFMNCASLVSLQITSFEEDEDGYSIMTIGEGALGGCINLESLSIPFVGPNEFMPAKESLNNTIRNGRGASTYQLGYIFGSYEYRDTTRIVQGEAFTSSNPAIYYFPSKLASVQLTHQTYLPSHSFWKTAMIKNVIIDDKTLGAQREVFHGCSGLESLSVPFAGMGRGLYYRSSTYGGLYSGPNSPWYGDYWYSEDYYLRNSIIWLFSNSPSDGHYFNDGITSWTGNYVGYIPNDLKYLTVTDETYFQTNAINGFKSLERVTIKKGENVDIAQMHIDEGILANCGNITTLDLPFIGRDYNSKHEHTKAYTIGWLFGNKYTYDNCYSVYQGTDNGATYQIPNKLTTISFDNYITTIANGAFRGMKSLESVKSNSVISQLGNYAFADCSSLVEVILPRATYSIMGDYAFSNCIALTDIDAFSPSTVRKIGHGALRGTSIKNVDFTRYYYVGDYAFSNCLQLTSVDLTEGGLHSGNTTGYLDYIGKHLFSGCTRLTDVKLADQTVDRQFVSDYMFEGCTSLEDIDLRGKVSSIPNGFLKDCSNLKSYYQVPDGIGAGTYIDKGLVIDPTDPNIKRIGAEAFKGCKSLTQFILPESLKTIGNAAFQNCTGLDVMRIPRSVNEINSIPLGTELNGVDNYTTGVYYGCDENRFHLEVFIPEDEWPWGNNWNCYFPVNIIGDQNENLFTYEYCTELKGYLINGLNMLTSDNPKGVNFAPNNRLLLSGVLKFPAKYNGLIVYGLTKDCFKDYYVNAYEGVNLVTRHPLAEVTDFVLGENFVTIGENAFNFDPAGKTTYRDIFSQKTAVQAAKLTSRLCDCNRNDSNIKHIDIAGLNYGNEKYYAANSIVYYQEAWTWTQVGRESTPVYTMDALKFSFDSTHFQYALGKEIKPRIVAIDVNDSYVKYPNNNKTPIRVADNDELY